MIENAIIGANGMVGRALMAHLSDSIGTYRNKRDNLIEGRKYDYLDITSPSAVYFFLETHKPKNIYIAAANAHVDMCENLNTDKVNIDAIKSLINGAYRIKAKVIFFSSSYVFDGTSDTPYRIGDKTMPINVYGRQKEKIERFLADYPELKWLVIRTVGVFGEEAYPKNFVAQVAKAVRNKSKIVVPTDQTMNPIYSMDLARITIKLSTRYENEIFHVAGDTNMTKYEFAVNVAYKLKHKKPHELVIGSKSENMAQLAVRPKNGCLDCGELQARAMKIPSFKKGLQRYLEGIR